MSRPVLAVTAALLAGTTLVSQAPIRDARRPTVSGRGAITGAIVTTEREPRPLRRAAVTVRHAESSQTFTAVTEDDGRFAIGALPTGEFTVTVSKDAYVTMRHGARRPGRPGESIVLGAGETRDVRVALPRGAVLTGVVTGADGTPMAGVAVSAEVSVRSPLTGRFTRSPVGNAFADDRGVYRIFGLAAGQYLVSARSRRPAVQPWTPSTAEIRRAMADARRSAGVSRPAFGPPAVTPAPRPDPPNPFVMAEVFHPAALSTAAATVIAVEEAEERTGVDIQIDYAPLSRVSGMVAPMTPGMSGAVTLSLPGAEVSGWLTWSAPVRPDGRFSFSGLPPGQYRLTAGLRGPDGQVVWGTTDVAAGGDDLSDVPIVLREALTLRGRVVFDGAAPPALRAMRVPVFVSALALAGSQQLPEAQVAADGTFTLGGLVPGPYTPLTRQMPGPAGWFLASITVAGRELLDAPLELTASADDVVVRFVDRTNEVRGVVRQAAGPRRTGYVVAFTPHRAAWFPGSRRVAAARIGADGHFRVRHLPAGDYLLALGDDLHEYEWFDPDILERLAAAARTVRVPPAGAVEVDLAWR